MRPDPDVVGRRIHGVLVLVHSRTDGIYEMNATAARVWELLAEGCDAAQIRAHLREGFEVAPEVLERETAEALAAFRQAQLVIEDDVEPH